MSAEPIRIAALVLAAGESARLGTPKQLLQWQGVTLLQKTIHEIQNIYLTVPHIIDITVVLGAFHEQILPTLSTYTIHSVYNTQWQKGMGESLRFGVESILQHSQPDYLLIALCDQPLVTDKHYALLLEQNIKSSKGIVASYYSNKAGVPAVFSKQYLHQLQTLHGAKGAQSVIKQHIHNVQTIDVPEAAFDIDTMQDIEVIMQQVSRE